MRGRVAPHEFRLCQLPQDDRPHGFGREIFDAIGRWRDKDGNGEAIDAAGELPDGKRFSSPQELKAAIAGRIDDLSRNLVERLLAYSSAKLHPRIARHSPLSLPPRVTRRATMRMSIDWARKRT